MNCAFGYQAPVQAPDETVTLPSADIQPVENPSGKTAKTENFPVGSWLIAKHLRPHIGIYYDFARAIDDIADSAKLSATEKLLRLDGFADALQGNPPGNQSDYVKATLLRESLLETGVSLSHGLDLIAAFRQDAVKNRYDDWADLVAYCQLSAAPVGRYLIDLHGGFSGGKQGDRARPGYGASDALCIALQVINHLQDCQDDYQSLDRVYLPGDWMAEEKLDCTVLDQAHSPAALRRVFDRMLDATETLLVEAGGLSSAISDRRLAMETSVIWHIAMALCRKLRRYDPLERRIVLSRYALVWCGLRGGVTSMVRRGKPDNGAHHS